jgi:GNAT superfamily N-acetyltransferase
MKEKYLEQIQHGIKCTNSYWSSKEIIGKLEDNATVTEIQLEALLFIEKTRYNFWRLYFYIQDITKINWDIFKEKELVAEIVVRNSKKVKWDSIVQAFEEKGAFKIYDTFNRMYRDHVETDVEDVDFNILETPVEKDLFSIQKLLEANFDLYSGRIPSLKELKTLVETTFIIKEKEQIVAFFITEKKGVTLEFRYWLVLEAYRGKKYGSILMKRVLTFDSEIKRIVSWISQKNKNVILAHKNLGFKEDGLTNYILYRE